MRWRDQYRLLYQAKSCVSICLNPPENSTERKSEGVGGMGGALITSRLCELLYFAFTFFEKLVLSSEVFGCARHFKCVDGLSSKRVVGWLGVNSRALGRYFTGRLN